MKKLFLSFISLLLILTLTACKKEDDSYNVAIIKLLDHASLDEIANSISSRLDEISKEKGITINYTVDSGNADATLIQQYASTYLANDVDLIIPIATLTAQIMVSATEGKNIPVVYAAISDPDGAGLIGMPNVTGTSDALNTNQIMDMILEVNPGIKKVGLLYSLSEDNSKKPIAEAKAYLNNKNIEFVEATGNNDSEISQAVASLIASNVEAIFTPTDNIVMASEIAIAETLKNAGIPHYTGADSFVRNGGFATCGVNYTELGAKTADIAYDALTGKDVFKDYHLMEGGIITVNTETAAALNIDYKSLSKFGTLVEVITTED